MTVDDLRKVLSNLPGDLRVSTRDSADAVEVRDFVDATTGATETVVQIFNSNGGRAGFTPMTSEVLKDECAKVLQKLCEDKTQFGSSRIMVNGAHRQLYREYGGAEDWKYGSQIDPRVWRHLLSKGFVKEDITFRCLPFCDITDEGRKYLETQEP